MIVTLFLSFFVLLVLASLIALLLHELNKSAHRKYREKKIGSHFKNPEQHLSLGRAHDNPVLREKEGWEGGAVMNPGAVEDKGRVHLFYRALGTDGASRIGYASSSDGVHFDERSAFPVFSLDEALVGLTRRHRLRRHPGLVASGGSWAGAEDPRAVIIGDRLYLSFSAFAGWDSVRMGVSSISLQDFRNREWNWTDPVFLSAPNEVHKNWVLFPEAINGQIAVLHSLHGASRNEVLIEYLDSVATQPRQFIRSPYQPLRTKGVWDSALRGAGPPPLKTSKGWLTFYHATDDREPHKYKIGAMLLDLADPRKVIARSKQPILEPSAHYEENGAKPGIVYSCGAVVRDGVLTLYYGAADNYICAAAAPLADFLRKLVDTRSPILVPITT
ncbi:MAG: hypothetical protein AAB472_02815 [Patescibacteria group bacterium]